MKIVYWGAAIAAAAMVGACGGDDGNGNGGPPPLATLNVTMSAPTLNVSSAEGQTGHFEIGASYTGSSSGNVVADVKFSDRRFVLDGAPVAAGQGYTVKFATVDLPAGGKTSTEVTFRLCTDAACGTVYPGSTQTFTVNLDVPLQAWGTFQRNGAHTGYVPVNYKVADFVKAWEYAGQSIQAPAATADMVAITTVEPSTGGTWQYRGTVRGLNAADGAEKWNYDLGSQVYASGYLSGPAISDGLVHVTSMESSSGTNPQWVFDLATGAFKQQMHFASQWSTFNQPVASAGSVYMSAGYYGNVVYGFDALSGAKRWETFGSYGVWAGESPAVDDNYVYYYSGRALDVIDRGTGVLVRSVADSGYQQQSYDWFSAPVLGSGGKVFLYSANRTFYTASQLIALDLNTETTSWRSIARYTTAFAYAGDTIYAVRDDAHVLSAINAATGEVKWSTSIPTSDTFAGNVVATGSHVFVSTENETWAIDLKDAGHKIVWTAPTGGRLAITPGNLLLTAQRAKLTAYKLF